MKRDDDPERLIRSRAENEGLRTLLSAGQDELPDAARLAALAARLGPMMGPGGPSGGGGGGSAAGAVKGTVAAASGATAAKVVAVLAAVMVTVGSVVAWRVARDRSQDAVPVSAVATTVESVSSLPAPAPPPTPDEPPVLVAADAGAAKTGQSTTTAHPSPKPVDPDQEVKLLHQAQDALAADPAQALSLCGEHAKSFPQGLLAQEREVIAIDALVRLGRANEAHARARRFAASYPASTHLRRIEALLEKAR